MKRAPSVTLNINQVHPLLSLITHRCSTDFNDQESVLRAARHVASMGLAREPGIRARLRHIFFDKATLTTAPTPKGALECDPSHPFFGLAHLRPKTINDFVQRERIAAAEPPGDYKIHALANSSPVAGACLLLVVAGIGEATVLLYACIPEYN